MQRGCLLAAVFLALSAPALAEGDAVAGRAVFRKCAACHSTEPGNRVGPSLAGIVGRPVASVPDYAYSDAMRAFGAGGKVWSEALISEYLLAPRAMVPGTRMAFAGLKRPEDIANLIAYLKAPAAP
jgi:cytochrome c